LTISFKATVKGQELLINSDRAIARHCTSQYEDIITELKAKLAYDEKFISELKTEESDDYRLL